MMRSVPLVVALCLAAAPILRPQDNPLNDPDLQKMLKQAQELQKSSTPVKLSDLQKKAAEMEAEAKKEEARQDAKEKAALQAQLAAPEPKGLPDWTPLTPQFAPAGTPVKKIDEGQVKIIQSGTSALTPKELGDAWEAALADKEINKSRNNISVNGKITVILFLTTRTDPREEVQMEAERQPGGKITKVKIARVLPKPDVDEDAE